MPFKHGSMHVLWGLFFLMPAFMALVILRLGNPFFNSGAVSFGVAALPLTYSTKHYKNLCLKKPRFLLV
jgi:hypothetical protein